MRVFNKKFLALKGLLIVLILLSPFVEEILLKSEDKYYYYSRNTLDLDYARKAIFEKDGPH